MSNCKHRQRMDELEAQIRGIDYEKELSLKSKAFGINDPRMRKVGEINEELWRNIAQQKEENLLWMIGKHDDMEQRAEKAEAERDELKSWQQRSLRFLKEYHVGLLYMHTETCLYKAGEHHSVLDYNCTCHIADARSRLATIIEEAKR